MKNQIYTKREVLKLLSLGGLNAIIIPSLMSFGKEETMIRREIPSSGEKLPVVGLGTWQTFDVGNSQEKKKILKQVLIEMNKHGGRFIDSSPMYRSSESVVGDLTKSLDSRNEFFYATKVWTSGKESGINQMRQSLTKMQREKMDLIQIHNLTDWRTHVKTLREWKEIGLIRYWGITHYVDSAHERLEDIIKSDSPDFVQFNYSITSRNAEKSLFETARRNKTTIIINQPFNSGSLFKSVSGKDLPTWCKDYGIESWGQYFLKFILSNELVNCVIPGTSKPHHVIDNMMAGYGKFPDKQARKKMLDYIKTI